MSKVSKLFDIRSKEYNKIYSESYSKKLLHQEKRVRAALIEKIVYECLSKIEAGVVVDVGCGMGNVLLNLKKTGVKAKLYGIDISKEMIRLANEKLNVFGYENIFFKKGSIDNINLNANVVLSIGVLGYQKEQEEFLDRLSSIVENEGFLIFTTANGDSFLRSIRRLLSKLNSFITGKIKSKGVEFLSIKDKQVANVLEKNGFSLEKKIYITFGLGLFASSIECFIDKVLLKYFSNSFLGKYISLTVIYVYKKVS